MEESPSYPYLPWRLQPRLPRSYKQNLCPSSSVPYPEYTAAHRTLPSRVRTIHLNCHNSSSDPLRIHSKYVPVTHDIRVFLPEADSLLPSQPHGKHRLPCSSCWQSDRYPQVRRYQKELPSDIHPDNSHQNIRVPACVPLIPQWSVPSADPSHRGAHRRSHCDPWIYRYALHSHRWSPNEDVRHAEVSQHWLHHSPRWSSSDSRPCRSRIFPHLPSWK